MQSNNDVDQIKADNDDEFSVAIVDKSAAPRDDVSASPALCYAIQRFLSDKEMPLETTEEDKLLDNMSVASKYGPNQALRDSTFTMSSSKAIASSDCCVLKCLKGLRRLCVGNVKTKKK